MNYSTILHELGNASLFDIYRLRIAMDSLLNHPEKLDAIKNQLRKGMTVSYFCSRLNKLSEAVIEEIHRTHVYAYDKNDGRKWSIPFYALNLSNVNTDIYIKGEREKLTRNQLQVGEYIGFLNKNNEEIYGEVIQLNPKTASIMTRDGARWRVPYHFLFKVLDELNENTSLISLTDATLP